MDLAFFDGCRWLRKWDFSDKKCLPRAVRIEIGWQAQKRRQARCGTVAYPFCRNARDGETHSYTMEKIKK
jgi:hypothetical protein